MAHERQRQYLWTLDEGGNPRPERNVLRWAKWLEGAGEARTVAQTELPGGRIVSTVFLGIDHNFSFHGPDVERLPVLWETMVFRADGKGWGVQRRYQSREDALAGHQSIVEELTQKRHERKLR